MDGLRQGKRKRTGSDNRPAKKRKMDLDDLEESSEEIESSEDEDEDLAAEEMAETAAEKRLRIAQQYLASARVTEQEKAEDRELDDTQLARKLDEEAVCSLLHVLLASCLLVSAVVSQCICVVWLCSFCRQWLLLFLPLC